jgi:dipeptidase
MSKYIDFARGDNPKNRMPLYVKAKEKLSVKDVADMMRDHYEGTEFDMTKGIAAGGHEVPYRWRPSSYEVDGVKVHNERAIATQQTGFWFVGQCRSWLPNEVGGLFWFAVDDAGTSPLSPFYACSNAISEHYAFGNGSMIEYSPTSMFWLQNRIAQFAYLRYNQIGKEVRENIDKHELSMMEMVAQADAEAMKMASTGDREDYLTNFSVHQANQLFNKWKTLDEYLLVKYIDGNIKRQNEDGSFKNNGHVKHVPPAPIYGGYSDTYKKAVAKEQKQ